MNHALRRTLKMLATRHKPNGEPNVFIKSLPRSGSTWLMELILTQPGFASFNEPCNLEKAVVRDHLGMSEWHELHATRNEDRFCRYMMDLCSGAIRDPRFNRPAPLSEFYRPVTRRAVFKIINAGEEHMELVAERCNGRIILLLRHPVPVSQSRKRFPKLATFLDSDFRRFFSSGQLAAATRVIENGDKFSRGVLDWCLHTSVALRSRTDAWTVVTYEQLVLDPEPAIRLMAERLELPEPERIFRRLAVPSMSTRLSDPGTQRALHADRDQDKQRWLVDKWRREVTDEELERAGELLAAFDLASVYRPDEVLPEKEYWVT